LFGGTVVENTEQTSEEGEALGKLVGENTKGFVRVVISTLPTASNFVLPESLTQKKPIVFDVNYKPSYTDLLCRAEQAV
jgi:shikimate 5-dehydrogenase